MQSDVVLYRFDCFELDPARFELRADGVAVAVEPQVLSLILLLVANSERMIDKDEIIEKGLGRARHFGNRDYLPHQVGQAGAGRRRQSATFHKDGSRARLALRRTC